MDSGGLSGDRGNAGHTTVAAFLPWRGSRADVPQPLTAAKDGTISRFFRMKVGFLKKNSENVKNSIVIGPRAD